MTHPEIEELLAPTPSTAVSPEEATELEQHLAECPRCRAELAAHRAVAGVLGNLSGTRPGRSVGPDRRRAGNRFERIVDVRTPAGGDAGAAGIGRAQVRSCNLCHL